VIQFQHLHNGLEWRNRSNGVADAPMPLRERRIGGPVSPAREVGQLTKKERSTMSIRVLLADDHAILLARELSPDIVLMDVSMPGLNGIEATRQIRHESPSVKIIALSMHSAKRFVTEMFKVGAMGYLLKDCDYDELARAIRTVAQGRTYLSPAISDVVVEDMVRGDEDKASNAFTVLTPREREVLQLMAEGNTTKQIGLRLHISPKTVEAHRLRVMNKLDIDNVAQLTKYAIQEGLTSPEP
jgi:DNA-binding NarL/FixJ family response regulator